METAFAELPLAFFTTLAPIGAGAFIALSCAFLTTDFTNEELSKINKLTIVPAIVTLVGFVAAFFHLGSPAKAFGVFAGVGSSPLSNEIAVGVVFVIAMLVYVALAFTGKLKEDLQKIFSVVVAILAVIFAAFCGLAYNMETIASWNTMLSPVQLVGFALIGGAAFGTLLLAIVNKTDQAKGALIAVSAVGAVLAVAGLIMLVGNVSAMSNALVDGASLATAVSPYEIAAVICLLLACGCTIAAAMGKYIKAAAGAAVIFALVGIFLARLVFYAVQLSVGICVL